MELLELFPLFIFIYCSLPFLSLQRPNISHLRIINLWKFSIIFHHSTSCDKILQICRNFNKKAKRYKLDEVYFENKNNCTQKYVNNHNLLALYTVMANVVAIQRSLLADSRNKSARVSNKLYVSHSGGDPEAPDRWRAER